MANQLLIDLSKLDNKQLIIKLLQLSMHTAISSKITPARNAGDGNPIESDYYSSVTERYFGDIDGCRLVERKRIGVKGLPDMHWIGLVDRASPIKWTPELQTIGYWIIG